MSFHYSLNFADTVWHIFSVFFVLLLGVLVAFFQYGFFRVPKRLALYLYSWHTVLCFFYYLNSLSNAADSNGYFLNSFYFNSIPIPGTSAVTFLTSIFTQYLGQSYGGVFLVFNIFGYVGVLAFASVVLWLTNASNRNVRLWSVCIIFLPGLSFWSSAIGKDSLFFLGVCLACWASMDLAQRNLAIIFSGLLLFIVRPYAATILFISLALTTLITFRKLTFSRLFILFAIILVALFSVFILLGILGLEISLSFSAIGDFVAYRQTLNMDGGLGVDIASMSVVMRMFTYLFRPLFFDVGGLFGVIIGIENLILLIAAFAGLYFFFKGYQSSLPLFSRLFPCNLFYCHVVCAW